MKGNDIQPKVKLSTQIGYVDFWFADLQKMICRVRQIPRGLQSGFKCSA